MELENKIIGELSFIKGRYDLIMKAKSKIVDLYVQEQRKHHEIDKDAEEEFYDLVKEELREFFVSAKKIETILEKTPYELKVLDVEIPMNTAKEIGVVVNELRDAVIEFEAYVVSEIEEVIRQLLEKDEVEGAEELKINMDYITFLNKHALDFTVELNIILDMDLN